MAGQISGMDERVRLSLADAGWERDSTTVTEVVRLHFHEFVTSMTAYPDAIPTLRTLRERGMATGLVSNASDHSVEIFRGLGLQPHFDVTVFSFEERCLKPAAAIYEAALDRLGLLADECLYVGDGGDEELRGARELGLTTVLVDRDLPHTATARPHATYVIRELAELVSLAAPTGTQTTATATKER